MATVWVLGAGFSKPLGGPVLTELFSPGSALKVKTCFPKLADLHGGDATLARMLFGDKDGPKQWQDAEEFLDYLDTAQLGAEGAPSYQALIEMIQVLRGKNSNFLLDLFEPLKNRTLMAAKIKPLAEMSRRLLAAECSAFLVNADVKTEKWRPYVRWADQAAPGDTVITFNYDLVIEKLAEATEATPGDKFSMAPAVSPGTFYGGRVNVLKLHGSVNWKRSLLQRDPDVFDISVHDDDYFALRCSEEEMVIASPGPTKFATASGPLGSLWDAAKAALKRADAIVFVGYRFPPSDSAARRELIDAIGENEAPCLVLHTVLGPNVHNEDTERLKSMLEVAMARKDRWHDPGAQKSAAGPPFAYSLKTWPLWAQDFLDLYDPAQLGPRNPWG